MNNEYEINEIIKAVDTLLYKKKSETILNKLEKPLQLVHEVENKESDLKGVPKETEKIILEAEKFLKK
tara:strand:- start:1034 stop:1237 length:204 start_codon:yes stop_codon:yes gene_type:complete